MKIFLGDLIQVKTDLLHPGESFKIGRAHLKSDDVLRCISVEGNVRTCVVRRTGTAFAFTLETLASMFEAIGFDGLEPIEP